MRKSSENFTGVAMGFQRLSSFQFLLAEVLLVVITAAITAEQALKGCPNYCGDVEIPYPFGTNPDCYLNKNFLITCNDSYDPPRPFLRRSNIVVTSINISGQLHALSLVSRDCYEEGKRVIQNKTKWFNLSEFTISNAQNRFTVIGCDSYGYIRGYIGNQTYRTGCMSSCNDITFVSDGSCIGTGCCQIEIPKRLKRIRYTAYSFDNHTNVSQFNPCTFAFVVEQSRFNFSSSYLFNITEERFPTVLDWTITGNGTSCEEARSNTEYACKENAECYQPDNSSGPSGYLCKCKKGYQGNPYLSNGCQDIDECKDPNLNDCKHECVNEGGSHTCRCRDGYHGDGRQGGEGCTPNPFQVVKVALGVGISFVVLLLSISWLYLVLKKRKLIKLKQKFFQQNGGFLLQQELSIRSGSSDTAKIFTAEELKKATNNYADDRIIGRGGYGTVYQGFLTDNSPVAIKKSKFVDRSQIDQFVNEVVVLSQINHRNVVRLLGCCLETEVPLLVYEFVSNGNLYEHIYSRDKASIISWETRLRIAAETAGVLSYLHSAASTPIIHRDVKSSNILLDHKYTAKVSDFGASKLVPMDATQLSTMVQGTLGYLDPEYLRTSQLTEKSDVYSFGVVVVELLTGKKPILFDRPEEERSLVNYFLSSLKESHLFEIVDNQMVNDENKEQVREVAKLAKRCLGVKGEERPSMMEVAMELEGLRMMQKQSWDNGEFYSEEKEYLLSDKCDSYRRGDGSNTTAVYDSIIRDVLVEFDGTGR